MPKIDIMKNRETNLVNLEKPHKKGNLGRPFEYLMSKSLLYADIKGDLLQNFRDRPRKYFLEQRNLLGDFWFMTTQGNFILIECKLISSSLSLPFKNISDHQIKNLYTIDITKDHKGWLLVWFKNKKYNYGVYGIRGYLLLKYIKEYNYIKKIYGLLSNIEDRHSISLTDIIALSNQATLKHRILNIPFKKIIDPESNKKIKILDLTKLY